MSVNSANARIFGSDSDAIYLAPYGTPTPMSELDVLDSAFEDVGWLHSDGITETLTGTKSVVRGYQGSGVVRTLVTDSGTQVRFVALESKPQTKALRYDEKSVSVVNGVRHVVRGAGQKVSVRTAVIDLFDADDVTVKERIVIPRLEIIPVGDRLFVSSEIAGFEFEAEIIGDYTVFEAEAVGRTAAEWNVNVTGTPTGGTYTLSINGFRTAPIAYDASAANVATAVNALSGVTGVSGVTGSGSVKLTFLVPVVVTADGANLTGGTTPSVEVSPA